MHCCRTRAPMLHVWTRDCHIAGKLCAAHTCTRDFVRTALQACFAPGPQISIWRIYCTCRPDAGCPPLLVQKAGPDCSLQHNTSARSGKWIDLSDGNHADAICIFNNQNPTRTPAKRANVMEYNITQPQDFLQRGIGFITKTLAKHTMVVDKNLHTLRGFLQRGTVLVLAPIPWLPDKSWQAAQDRRSR